MNIDLLPINAFSLESCAAADNHTGIVHTLTLKLTPSPALPCPEPMEGFASALLEVKSNDIILRAGVVPAMGAAMTITF